jgi:hypothetical protein
MRHVPATADYLVGLGCGHGKQLFQRFGSGAVHRIAHQQLYGFQIEVPTLAAARKDYLQQAAHFLADFLLDGFGRFFSSVVRVSSIGRKRQICSLT